jgi:hypothetical protein
MYRHSFNLLSSSQGSIPIAITTTIHKPPTDRLLSILTFITHVSASYYTPSQGNHLAYETPNADTAPSILEPASTSSADKSLSPIDKSFVERMRGYEAIRVGLQTSVQII